jgi:hypothetical protein
MQKRLAQWCGLFAVFASVLAAYACSGSRSSGGAPRFARLLVSADTVAIDPEPAAVARFDRQLLGGREEGPTYRLSTPANTPFAFDLTTWMPNLSGDAEVRVRHLANGGQAPTSPISLLEAGMHLQGRSIVQAEPWFAAGGSGFARLSVHGEIATEQVLGIAADSGPVSIIVLEIGPPSIIRRPTSEVVTAPAGMTTTTLYSSAAWQFGMPAVTVSGDRTSVVCYEGDQQQPIEGERFELRLQHDAATGLVTGGASPLAESWAGSWRDHEIAALWNVLAVARCEREVVRLRLSFDRGASFAQEVVFPSGYGPSRLVQVAMAADYSLALVFWRTLGPNSPLECVLVEGQPAAFDLNGSPTWFTFPTQQVLGQLPANSTPLTSGIVYSSGGDLVVGYGGSRLEEPPLRGPGLPDWISIAEFHCATRLYGQAWQDRLVHEERLVGVDPTVAVSGSGAGLQIYYAFEAADGIRLAHSADAGHSFALAAVFGQPGDYLPSVFCRPGPGGDRIDVLYLAPRLQGLELLGARWSAGLGSPRQELRLLAATSALVPVGVLPGGRELPWGRLMTQVGWLGYDAAIAGEELVVAVDQHTCESWTTMVWAPQRGRFEFWPQTTGLSGGFRPSEPPPLAPGLTEPLRAPLAADAHQLLLLRLP